MKKLAICFLACIVLLSVGAMAFASGGGEKGAKAVSFTYANFIGKENDQVGCTIDTYVKAHPNVTINYQIMEHETLQEKLQVMVNSNTLPDMFWWNAITLAQTLANNPNSLLDLTPYYDTAFKSKFIDGTFNLLATADGKIAGFPAEAQVQAWMWNKALFTKYNLKIPTT
jgi:raffinose/stachyose/melibiose transport system substrate-binding protein